MARLPQIRPSGVTANVNIANAAAIEAEAQAGAFGTLSDGAAALRRQLQPELDRLAEDEAARNVNQAFDEREDPNSLPNIRRRRIWSQQDAVYNNAVQAGTLARAEIDLDNAAATFREQFAFDPEGYEAASREFLQGYLGGEDESNFAPGMTGLVELRGAQRFNRDRTRIEAETRARAVAESQEALELRLQNIRALIETGVNADPAFTQTEEFLDLQSDSRNIVGELVDNPAFGWSAERGADALDSIANGARESLLYHAVDQAYAEGGAIGAVGFIDEQLATMELDNAGRLAMRSRLMGRVNQAEAIENNQRQLRAMRDAELRAARENAAADYEARALADLADNGVLSPDMVQEGLRHVQSQGISGARFQTLMNARPPSEIVVDPRVAADMYDLADTPGTTRDVMTAALDSALGNTITWQIRRDVLDRFEANQDERLEAPYRVVEAFFAQADTFGFDTGTAVMEREVLNDTRDWAVRNPDATRAELEQYATQLSIQRGRTIPPPPIVGLPTAPIATSTPEQVQQWRNQAEEQIVEQEMSGEIDSARADELMRRVETYLAWQSFQSANNMRADNASQ